MGEQTSYYPPRILLLFPEILDQSMHYYRIKYPRMKLENCQIFGSQCCIDEMQ